LRGIVWRLKRWWCAGMHLGWQEFDRVRPPWMVRVSCCRCGIHWWETDLW
jgi:hypothetical protein